MKFRKLLESLMMSTAFIPSNYVGTRGRVKSGRKAKWKQLGDKTIKYGARRYVLIQREENPKINIEKYRKELSGK